MGNRWPRDPRLADRDPADHGAPAGLTSPHRTAGGGLGSPRCSRAGSWVAAQLHLGDGSPITVVSVYAAWERSIDGQGPIWADGSAHRILSDLSPLLSRRDHRILVAGDLNLLYGYGEHGHQQAARRYQSVFDRADALGLAYLGPRSPGGGRRACPWPTELPEESTTVPTYHTRKQGPAGATRQLDHVFASRALADHVEVVALNDPSAWGPSDHCRISIEVRL
jgi:hypothetical protein